VDDARKIPIKDSSQAEHRDAACRACDQGVHRAHIISYERNGALIEELFTHDGGGTLISQEVYERARRATVEDIAGVLDLIRPLEDQGVLVRRSRERLEQEINNFRVLERDGRVIACAALYPFGDSSMAEIACVATHEDYRRGGRGQHLLELLQEEAKKEGLLSLFVLTTQSAHWFLEQGFSEGSLEKLPAERQALYNLQRNSKVLIREIT